MRPATFLAVAMILGACASGPRGAPSRENGGQRGVATWYGRELQGHRTASGERFDMNDLTAAHLSLPFGTRVRVTNLRNHRSVVVRINDRGPYGGHGHIIDLSRAAASRLGITGDGSAPVVVEVVGPP